MTELTKIIEIIGSQSKLAETLTISPTAIGKWVDKGAVPSGRVLEVFELVKSKKTAKGQKVCAIEMLKQAKQAEETKA